MSTSRDARDQYSFPQLSTIAKIGWTMPEEKKFPDCSNRLVHFSLTPRCNGSALWPGAIAGTL